MRASPIKEISKYKYNKYLKSLNSRKITPDKLIEDYVTYNLGKKVISKSKIVAGEVNKVYNIILEDKTEIILRISHSGFPVFQQEAWAIKKVEKKGVPV